MDFTDRHRLHILRCVGLGNMSYDQTAAELNAKFGLDVSADQVGAERRAMQVKSEELGLESYHGEVVREAYVEDINRLLRQV